MAFAPLETYFNTGDGSVRGGFYEKDFGLFFEFSKNLCKDEWSQKMFDEGYEHLVWVNSRDPSPRYAKVLKTRAYVMVDEDVVEKWYFKSMTNYEPAQ